MALFKEFKAFNFNYFSSTLTNKSENVLLMSLTFVKVIKKHVIYYHEDSLLLDDVAKTSKMSTL